MVFTRGHRDNGEDEKASVPSRECRRSNRTMEEPEDEMFWESDDIGTHKSRRSGNFVPKKEIKDQAENETNVEKDGHRSPGRSNEVRKSLEFAEETEKAPSRRNSRLSENVEPSEATETEDEIFEQPRPVKRRSKDEKEIFNEMEASDHESGLRRSSRRRAFQPYSEQSWLVGDKKVKGYPAMIHSSEPENEEPRAARKSRYIKSQKSEPPRRKSKRFSANSMSLSRSRRYESPRNLRQHRSSRYVPCYQEDDEEVPEEDMVHEEDNTVDKSDNKQSENAYSRRYSRRRQRGEIVSNHAVSRPRRVRHVETHYEEESEEEIIRYRPRRNRSVRQERRSATKDLPDKKEESSESEDKDGEEEEEERDEEKKEPESRNTATPSARRRVTREPILRDIENGEKIHEVPHKRMRKPVSRLMYEASTNHRKRRSDSSGSSSSSSEDDRDQGKRRYSLRKNRKPLRSDVPYNEPSHRHQRKESLASYLNSPARKPVFTRRHGAAHGTTANSSSSSSEEKEFEKRKAKSMNKARNRCLPVNLKPEDLQLIGQKDRKVGSSLADVDPMSLDTSITFDSIGGLAQHVKALKEMILFPIMYPEVFQKFSVTPPRGVLFYGPPGTGKTLVARALANECSLDDRKVAFFMRKGADCLSKWVGESERQLRLLFDQAYQMRPSIIFFDEIDGLAPVRSSRQDQIHSSIVSTLLALLDGIDSRGEIVIIGATNRIDAIDPALRRPGRFDREFHFPLPSVVARKHILKIHTSKWESPPSEQMLNSLAEKTVGYCGADLKSLCAESTLYALRTQFPQIYTSNKKLLIDTSKIRIKKSHFEACISKIVPAGQRAASSAGRKLDEIHSPLLLPILKGSLNCIKKNFPHGFTKLTKYCSIHRPRFLITGSKGQGQTTVLAPAIIHAMERLPTHKLDFPSLFSVSARAPEEACAQVFHEARLTAPSILYVPLIDDLWLSSSETIRSTFSFLLNQLDSSLPILLLATSSKPYMSINPEIQELFSIHRDEVYAMSNPLEQHRRELFTPLFMKKMLLKPLTPRTKKEMEELPVAPAPKPRELKEDEIHQLEEIEEASLRELRIFLRQICAKLAKNKQFYIFTKPVDLEEVPDYLQVISEPMDLETMMTKIDLHKYECAQDFLRDIELIVLNALEYNPDKNPEDKMIRHRACTLRDTAYAYIKAEMDTDFEDNCRSIRNNRQKRQRTHSRPPHFLALEEVQNEDQTQKELDTTKEIFGENKKPPSSRKRKRKSTWYRGMISKRRKLDRKETEVNGTESTDKIDEDDEKSKDKTTDSEMFLCNGVASNGSQDSMKETPDENSIDASVRNESMEQEDNEDMNIAMIFEQKSDESPEKTEDPKVTVDGEKLQNALDSCINVTEDCTVEEIRFLYVTLSKLIQAHRKSWDRNPLVKAVESEIRRFEKAREQTDNTAC